MLFYLTHSIPFQVLLDDAVEVAEVARFHAPEVSIVIMHNLALTYIVPRSIGVEDACGCCGRRTRNFFNFCFGVRVHVPHIVDAENLPNLS